MSSYHGRATSLANEAIIYFDAQLRIIEANPVVETMYGSTPEEIRGHIITDIVVSQNTRTQTIERVRNALSTGTVQRWEGRATARDDRALVVHCTVASYPAESSSDPGGVMLIQDVTERHRAEQRMATAQAESIDLVHRISHDLKEPLRMITSFAELLEEEYGALLEGEGLEYLHFITDGANNLQERLAALLAYSRVRTSDSPEPVDCTRVLDQVVHNLKDIIEQTDAQLSCACLPSIIGRPQQVQQCFRQLIDNALKFHRPDEPPRIEISAQRHRDEWIISVRDHGIGFPADQADEIFNVFRRLHPQGTYPGVGIGLAICKRVMNQAGGRIWAEPAPNDTGAQIHLAWPVTANTHAHRDVGEEVVT